MAQAPTISAAGLSGWARAARWWTGPVGLMGLAMLASRAAVDDPFALPDLPRALGVAGLCWVVSLVRPRPRRGLIAVMDMLPLLILTGFHLASGKMLPGADGWVGLWWEGALLWTIIYGAYVLDIEELRGTAPEDAATEESRGWVILGVGFAGALAAALLLDRLLYRGLVGPAILLVVGSILFVRLGWARRGEWLANGRGWLLVIGGALGLCLAG